MTAADPVPAGFIDDYLAYLLAQASHLISHEFHAVARQAGIPVLQWRVLAALVDGQALSVGEVAKIILTPQSTLTRVAHRMCEQGLIERRSDDTDRRITRLQITPFGLSLARRLVAQARAHEDCVLAPLGQGQAAALKHALRVLIGMHQQAPADDVTCAPAPAPGAGPGPAP
jgi:DNA-binding MarR family transcriptional regulator